MDTSTPRSSFLLKLLVGVALLVLLTLFILSSHALSNHFFDTLASVDAQVTHYVHVHKITSIFLFSFVFCIAATLALPIESALCVLAGYYFRAVLGIVISVFSIAIGATLMFLLMNYLFTGWLQSKSQSKTIQKITQGVKDDAFSYILFLRLIPLFPQLVTNTALALSNVRKRDYIVATFIGIIPATTIFVLAGTQLESIKRTGQVLTPESFGVLLLLAFFALFPLLWKKFFSREQSTS